MRRGLSSLIAVLLLANLLQAPVAQAAPALPQTQPAPPSVPHKSLPLQVRGGEAGFQLAATPLAPGARGLFVAQFRDAIRPSSLDALREAGAEVGPYMGAQAYAIWTTPAVAAKLAADARFSSVVRYSPAWKVSPAVKAGKSQALRVLTFAAPSSEASAALQAVGAQAAETAEFHVESADLSAVERLAQLEDVLLIEPVVEHKLLNDVAAGIMKINTPGGPRADGLTGLNQVIGIADTGLDTGNSSTLHPDLRSHLLKALTYGRAGVWSDPHGHGTHVAGSVLGDGTASGGQIKGTAPGAKMVFQSLLTSGGGLGFPSTGLAGVLNEAYNYGARIHTNSWGADVGGAYTSDSAAADSVTAAKRDYTVLFAAGNAGDALYTVGTPATAKNVIAVGASENLRPALNPISDNANEMAWFSSRGPTSDGRVKPDVVAPGTFILSTRSSLAPDTAFWENYDHSYAYMGGTSMATPLAAGAAAVVRQHYTERRGIAKPSSALIKATLINGAQDMGYGWGSPEQGWGRIDLTNSLDPVDRTNWFQDEKRALQTGQSDYYEFQASAGAMLKFTLTWTDPPANPAAFYSLVNDLDLYVEGPDGKQYLGNCFQNNTADGAPYCATPDWRNNVENVYLAAPTAGTYKVWVDGYNVPSGSQPYALVVSGKELLDLGDTIAPTMTVGGLSQGASVKGTVAVTAAAADNRAVTGVEFRVDGEFQAFDSAAPYTWNWNTAGQSGTKSVTVTARDGSGNTTTATYNVTMDSLAPTVSFTGQTSPTYLPAGIHPMTVDAADANGIAKVEFYQGTTKKFELTAPPFIWNWNTAGVASGTYSLVAKAYDLAGNVGTATLSVVLDTALPTVSLSKPTAGSFVRGLVPLAATATDAGGIASIDLRLDGQSLHLLTASPYTWSWDTTQGSDGPHTLTAVAFDRAGNLKTSTAVPITIDNTAPTISLPYAAGALIRNGAVVTPVVQENIGISKVEFLVDNQVKSTDTTAPFTWAAASLSNGAHTLGARVTDKAGNVATSTPVSVTVDNLVPTGVAMTGVAANSTVQGTRSLSITGTDATGVTRTELWVDGSLATTLGATPVTTNWETTAIADGRHTLQAKVFDGAGNLTATSLLTITVDNLGPVVGTITPGDGASIRGTTTITAAVTDAVGVQKVEFFVDGIAKVPDTSAPYSLSLGTTTLTAGLHTLKVLATDKVGHQAEETISLTVDNTAPTVQLSPLPSVVGPGLLTVTAVAADNNALSRVEFYLGTTKLFTATSAEYVWNWNTSSVTSGTYQLKAIATDAAGNSTTSAIVSVKVDTTKPTLTLSAPAAGATLKGSVPVNATATDASGVTQVEFYVDDLLQGSDTTAPFAWTWDTTGALDGGHKLTVKAYDSQGNSSVVDRSLKVDNTAPTVDFANLLAGAIIKGGFTVQLAATDAVGIVKAEYYLDSTKYTVTAAPFRWTMPSTVIAGSHQLRVVVTDGAGWSTATATITITVDKVAPTLTVTGITGGTTVSGTRTITAVAADGVGIDRIELWVGTTRIDSIPGGSATFSWDTTLMPNGAKTVYVRAYDLAGNLRELRYTVTVKN